MGDETLSAEELDSLLESAEIVSGKSVSGEKEWDDTEEELLDEEELVEDEEEEEEAAPLLEKKPAPIEEKKPEVSVPIEDVDVSNLTGQQKHNIDLLLDIYVQVTVELGRTSIKVKDVLGLGEGSIIELNKPANEPVDLLVNNRLVARGEVVVIDENFGARVTDIVSPNERIQTGLFPPF